MGDADDHSPSSAGRDEWCRRDLLPHRVSQSESRDDHAVVVLRCNPIQDFNAESVIDPAAEDLEFSICVSDMLSHTGRYCPISGS